MIPRFRHRSALSLPLRSQEIPGTLKRLVLHQFIRLGLVARSQTVVMLQTPSRVVSRLHRRAVDVPLIVRLIHRSRTTGSLLNTAVPLDGARLVLRNGNIVKPEIRHRMRALIRRICLEIRCPRRIIPVLPPDPRGASLVLSSVPTASVVNVLVHGERLGGHGQLIPGGVPRVGAPVGDIGVARPLGHGVAQSVVQRGVRPQKRHWQGDLGSAIAGRILFKEHRVDVAHSRDQFAVVAAMGCVAGRELRRSRRLAWLLVQVLLKRDVALIFATAANKTRISFQSRRNN